jgi:hypothetical protein
VATRTTTLPKSDHLSFERFYTNKWWCGARPTKSKNTDNHGITSSSPENYHFSNKKKLIAASL